MNLVGALASRRLWGQLLLCGAVIGVLALAISAVGVTPKPPWADATADAADGYPERVARPYVIRELPAKPGPLAGLVRTDESWLAVSPAGRLWELTDDDDRFDVTPALSDDGRFLAYLRTSEDGFGEYVIRNLTSGVLTAIPDVASGASDSDATFWVAEQHPAYVSPDGRRVLLRGGRTDDRTADALVLSVDHGVRELFLAGAAFPAGWLPDGRIAWLVQPTYSEFTRSPEIVGTTDKGAELGRVELELPDRASLSQWSPNVSPDGKVVALSGEDVAERSAITLFSLPDGDELESSDAAEGSMLDRCVPSWRKDRVVVPTPNADMLVDTDGHPVVVGDTRLTVGCSIWAPQALDGDVHRGLSGRLFGTSDDSWTWRWQEIGIALLLGLAAVGVWLGRRRPVVEPPAQDDDQAP